MSGFRLIFKSNNGVANDTIHSCLMYNGYLYGSDCNRNGRLVDKMYDKIMDEAFSKISSG